MAHLCSLDWSNQYYKSTQWSDMSKPVMLLNVLLVLLEALWNVWQGQPAIIMLIILLVSTGLNRASFPNVGICIVQTYTQWSHWIIYCSNYK